MFVLETCKLAGIAACCCCQNDQGSFEQGNRIKANSVKNGYHMTDEVDEEWQKSEKKISEMRMRNKEERGDISKINSGQCSGNAAHYAVCVCMYVSKRVSICRVDNALAICV